MGTIVVLSSRWLCIKMHFKPLIFRVNNTTPIFQEMNYSSPKWIYENVAIERMKSSASRTYSPQLITNRYNTPANIQAPSTQRTTNKNRCLEHWSMIWKCQWKRCGAGWKISFVSSDLSCEYSHHWAAHQETCIWHKWKKTLVGFI